MKHSKLRLVIGVLLIAVAMFSVMVPVSAEGGAPLHYIAFDSEYYHDAIGNAYGFTNVEYIDVKDNANIKGAVRLTFEKSPYEYMGTYDKDGYHGVFDPYFHMPLYEIEQDIKCEDIQSIVVYARVQNKEGHTLKVNNEKPFMYFSTDLHPVIRGEGDFLQAAKGFRRDSDEWVPLLFNISKSQTAWSGILQNLRIDPFGTANDDMDYIDIAGVAFFEAKADARAFDGNFVALRSGSSAPATSSFAMGSAVACIALAFGINGDLFKKKRAKAILAICLVAVLAFGMVACGDNGEETNPTATSSTTESVTTSTPGTTATPTDKPSVGGTTTVKEEKLAKSGQNDQVKYELYETYAKVTKYIGKDAEVVIPDTIEGLPVKVIGYKAMFRQYNLKDDTIGVTKLTLPDSLEIIEDYALAGLEEVVEINFGKNLYSIGSNAIENCYSLKKLNFTGTNLTIIDSWAFSGDRVIEEITLPEGVQKIGNAAFQHCHSMAEDKLSIPSTVTEKGKGLMFACTPLPEGEDRIG